VPTKTEWSATREPGPLDEYAAATSAYRAAFAKVRPAKEAGFGLSEVLLASKAARETCGITKSNTAAKNSSTPQQLRRLDLQKP
jgi:thioredoxin-like negative regulator of GroEL